MNRGSGSQVMDTSSATVMGGPKGEAVLAASERDGEMEYAIQTTAPTGWRPVCAPFLSADRSTPFKRLLDLRVRPDCAFDDVGGQAPNAPWALM
jgi:hypothetical protein